VHICYVDESGGTEAPDSNPSATPLMVIAGLAVHSAHLPAITTEFLTVKRTYFPHKCRKQYALDHILSEVKGAEIRADVRSGSRNTRRHALGYLDRVIEILENHQVRLVGRVWVKAIGQALDPRPSYTFSIQDIAHHFQRYLTHVGSQGIVIADSRMHNQNSEVSHSIFTIKQGNTGDRLPSLVEVPVFGSSENHALLQLADIVASALLFPIAARVYCAHQWPGVHTNPRFDALRHRYAARLSALQYGYQDATGDWREGIVVSDPLGHLPSSRLFQAP
jgi:hypothetical protein